MSEAVKEAIRTGKTALGIEFGSTRIKAVLVDESHAPIAMGTYDWENRLENNIWTYSLEDLERPAGMLQEPDRRCRGKIR